MFFKPLFLGIFFIILMATPIPFEEKKYFAKPLTLRWLIVFFCFYISYEFWFETIIFSYNNGHSFFFIWTLYILYTQWRIRKYPILLIAHGGIGINFNGLNPTLSGGKYIPYEEIDKIWFATQKSRWRHFFRLKDEYSYIYISRNGQEVQPRIILDSFKENEQEEIKELVGIIQEWIEIREKEHL